MLDQAILNYIRENLAGGYTEEQVREGLVSAGFDQATIEQAFEQIKQENQQPAQTAIPDDQAQSSQQDSQDPSQSMSQSASPSGGDTSSKSKNGFKMIFIALSCVVVFLFLAGMMLAFMPRGERDQGQDTGVQDDFADPGPDLDDEDIWDDGQDILDPDDGTVENDTGEDLARQCRLGVSNRNLVVEPGVNRGLFVRHNQGDPQDVRWEVDDDSIASINPTSSTYTAVTALSPGQTRITATDLSVGEGCSYTVLVTVTEG